MKLIHYLKLFLLLIRDYGRIGYLISNLVREENCRRKIRASNKFQDGFPQIDISELTRSDSMQIAPYTFMDGVLPVTDAMMLKGLCISRSCDTYMELGTWRGESIAIVADSIKRGITISFSEEDMVRRNFVPQSAVKASRMFLKGLENIEVVKSDTATFDFGKLKKSVDIAFIDADHSYAGVLRDTKNVFPTLRDKKSVIIWHDYGHTNEKINWQVMKAILDGMPPELHKNIYHIKNTLCAIFINDEVKTSKKELFYPKEVYQVTIDLKEKLNQ